jgi:hypothetical protein
MVTPERDHLENPSVDGEIILRLTYMKWDGGGFGLSRLRIRTDVKLL